MRSGRAVLIPVQLSNVELLQMDSLDEAFEILIDCLEYKEKNFGSGEYLFQFMIHFFEQYEQWARGDA